MKLKPEFRRLRRPGKRDVGREVDEEIRAHLEMQVERLRGEGLPEQEARRLARERFGDEAPIRAECSGLQRQLEQRAAWRDLLGSLGQDLRYGLRGLLGQPDFTLAVVVVLALGIGANTAAFSFVNSLLLHPLPVREPERLVRMYMSWDNGTRYASWSYPDFADVRERAAVFAGVAAESPRPLHLSDGGRSERIWGWMVAGDYFNVLGIELPLGRGFLPQEEATPDTHPVVVISHGMWQRRFGSDAAVLGRTIVLNGREFSIVGVAPADFHGTLVGLSADIWAPYMMAGALAPGEQILETRANHGITQLIGRLRPGISVQQARADMASVMAGLEQEYPDTNRGTYADVLLDREAGPHPMMRSGLIGFFGLLFAVVGVVLLLGCANIAGLLLARAASRAREIGIRRSLGASRGRLIRQLCIESLLLGAVGGGAGLLLAGWLVQLVGSAEIPGGLPVDWNIALDLRVLGFTAVTSLAAALLFGLAPAVHATRPDLVGVLKADAALGSATSSLARRAMVVCQVGLSVVLLVAAGLVMRSLANAAEVDVGFEPEGQLVAEFSLQLQGYGRQQRRQFRERLGSAVASLPGVQAVGFGMHRPLTLSNSTSFVVPDGYEVPEGASPPDVRVDYVDHGYFAAMGIPLVRGRPFDARDTAEAPPVIIVNGAFAERFWAGEDPIGKHVDTRGRLHEVVGVVPTGKYVTLGEPPTASFYLAMEQTWDANVYIHVRTAGEPAALLPQLRQLAREIDPDLPVMGLETMTAGLGLALLPARLAAAVVSVFAVLALLLAATGLYGVLAFAISRSVHEIGVRMALGATAREVTRMVVHKGMRLTGVGVLLGLAGGAALSQALTSLLHGVSPTEPGVYLIGAAVILLTALVASWVPAQRATRIDPAVALRSE